MDPICIDREVLGTPSHLIIDEGAYRWSPVPPEDAWHLSGAMKPGRRCLDTLLALGGRSIGLRPPEAFVRAMETCMSGSGIVPPWQRVMPGQAHRDFMKGIIKEVEESITSLPKDYYEGTWATGSAVLGSLQPAHVDREIWRRLLDARVGNWRVVQTFEPDESGRCRPITYDRFGTRTGRLTVASGPGILTLKRGYRPMLRSRYGDDGVVAYLDFANLEARIMLYEAGGRCDDVDLYGYINRELFAGDMDRDDIKGAVISELYGQGKRALGRRLGLSGAHLDHFVRRVKGYFKTDSLLQRVKGEFLEKGHITNRYGRRVEVDEPLDNIFINSYTQSTGVDLTMLGFWRVIEATRDRRIDPLYLLHDAMLLDCHRDDLRYFEAIDAITLPGYVQKFYLKLELLGCTLDEGEVVSEHEHE